MNDAPANVPIPAATLILFRDATIGPPELLFVERSATMAFAAGALVFPGGRIDAGDYALAERIKPSVDMDDWDGAARIAAIRETIEEVGLGIGITSCNDVAAIRDNLLGGEPISAALASCGGALQLDNLTPFARWCPEFDVVRMFDTRFYIARLPDDAPVAIVDGTENVRTFWASAKAVLAQADAGQARIIFPTRRTLERLASFADFAAAAADAARYPVRKITPWVEDHGGERHLLHSRRSWLSGHLCAVRPGAARLIVIRRLVRALVIVGVLLGLALAALTLVRNRPQDVPFTPLKLDQPIGMFTGRKVAALTGDFARCRALLDETGVRYETLAPVEGDQCGYTDGVELTGGGSRSIDFRPSGLGVSCPVAVGLALWEWQVLQTCGAASFR